MRSPVAGLLGGRLLCRVLFLGGRSRCDFFDLVFLLRVLVILDDLDAHFGQGRLDILDLVAAHLALRESVIELVIGDVALLLRLGEELFDRSFIEVDQGSVVVLVACDLPPLVPAIDTGVSPYYSCARRRLRTPARLSDSLEATEAALRLAIWPSRASNSSFRFNKRC